jgi:hypothetical protein
LDKGLLYGGQLGSLAAATVAGLSEAYEMRDAMASGLVLALAGQLTSFLGGHRISRASAEALLDEHDRIARAVVRFIAQKCFRVPPPGTVLRVPPYRATALMPDVSDQAITPRWRAYSGEQVTKANSKVSFARGDQLAGFSWNADDANHLQIRDNLPTVGDMGNDVNAWRAEWMAEGVPSRVLEHMGSDDSRGYRYMEHVRSILCFRVNVGKCCMVIAIDSTLPSAFDSANLILGRAIGETIALAQFVGEQVVAG